MKRYNSKSKSYSVYYWAVWIFITVLYSVFVYTNSTYTEDQMFNFNSIYVLSVSISLMMVSYYENNRMLKHLKLSHPNLYRSVSLGLGGVNSFKFIPFIFSEEFYSDNQLRKLKSYNQQVHLLGAAFFITVIIMWLMNF